MTSTSTPSTGIELVEHEGAVILLGDRQYVLPPMTLRIRKMDIATRKALQEGYTEASEQDLMVSVLVETLRRNYPGLMAADIEDVASYDQIVEAYATLKEQEARLVAEVGKRLTARAMATGPSAQAEG